MPQLVFTLLSSVKLNPTAELNKGKAKKRKREREGGRRRESEKEKILLLARHLLSVILK